MKLIMVDLDGTLVDTTKVNYNAYKEAINQFGYEMDYEYYSKFCNGRHYKEFLPQVTTDDEKVLREIHKIKKDVYKKYLHMAILNTNLLEIIRLFHKNGSGTALVTTASKKNVNDILDNFNLHDDFDLIITNEDVKKLKPDPEGYILAMERLSVKAEECIIFEDSEVGIKAAESTGAAVFVVKGYN